MLAWQLEQRPSLVMELLPQLQQTAGAVHLGQSFRPGGTKTPEFQQLGNQILSGS